LRCAHIPTVPKRQITTNEQEKAQKAGEDRDSELRRIFSHLITFWHWVSRRTSP
jgi:hypothetical protein